MRRLYFIKYLILEVLVCLNEGRFLIYDHHDLPEDDTGEWVLPDMVMARKAGYGRVYIGRGLFRGWTLFWVDRNG